VGCNDTTTDAITDATTDTITDATTTYATTTYAITDAAMMLPTPLTYLLWRRTLLKLLCYTML
jgi:hypothetical protein